MRRSKLGEALAAIASAMRDIRARWYVFGAQAAILHGIARATADIDVTVDLGRRPTRELVASLAVHGLRLRFADAAFVRTTRVLPLVHESGVPVDVVLAGPGLEDLFFERVVHRRIGGVRVPVASAEDVIVMKTIAGRAKDLEDVRGILAANPKLDERCRDAGATFPPSPR
jgi:hypothetical protein